MSENSPLRVRIAGTLRLTTDLYLGDGHVEARPQRQGDGEVDVATVATDHAGRPTIPAAALRGVVRAYLERRFGKPDADLFALFGRAAEAGSVNRDDLSDEEMGHGGRVEFAYATLAGEGGGRRNSTHVGIDRKTRTAADRVLYAADYVPRGTAFHVTATGFGLTRRQTGLLLRGLHGFNDAADPVRLGAGHADLCGTASWETTSVEEVDAAAVRAWLNAPVPWHARRPPDAKTDEGRYLDAVPVPERQTFRVAIALSFDSPLLVNDPDRTRPRVPRTDAERALPHHAPRRLPDGRVYLPASSFRGAFRSQAERIVRTLNPARACDPTAGPRGGEVDRNDLAKALFGHAGRRSALYVSDFVPAAESRAAAAGPGEPQEFIAIDRFTGGGADQLKFNADRVNKPLTLVGTIALAADDSVSLGLLVLALRDLIEGDVSFGWGAAKGYGACTAFVAGWPAIGGKTVEQLRDAVAAFRQRAKEPTDAGTD